MRRLNVTDGRVAGGADTTMARQRVALARQRSVREAHTAKVTASKAHASKVVTAESHPTEPHPAEMSKPVTSKAAAKVPAEARLGGDGPQAKRAKTDNDEEPSCKPARHAFLHRELEHPGAMAATAFPQAAATYGQ